MPQNNALDPQPLSAESLAAHPSLSLFQKVLLTTDGTVTELLGLYTGEAILARKLEQSLRPGLALPHLDCLPDTPVLHRRILLVGAASGRAHLYAESGFVFGRFSPAIQHGLLHTEQPIGLLWRNERLEMYREIVDRRIERCEATSALFGLPAEAPLLARTYLIFHGGHTLGVITEKFPAGQLR
jgi:chorismate-pyruvate lyase